MEMKRTSEIIAKWVFTVFAIVAIVAVCSITVYMIYIGTPALSEVGVIELLFGTEWKPTADEPKFGIFYVILTSVLGTTVSLLVGVPIGILTAVFLAEIGNKNLVKVVQPAVELLAAVPSVIYGLLGIMILKPLIYQLEMVIYKNSPDHQFTGGANFLSANIVLAIIDIVKKQPN